MLPHSFPTVFRMKERSQGHAHMHFFFLLKIEATVNPKRRGVGLREDLD